MRGHALLAAVMLSVSAAACTTMAGETASIVPPAYTPPEGVSLYREGPIEGAPDHHLVLGDMALSAGTVVARHFHTGEEYVYVLGGEMHVTIEDGEGGSQTTIVGAGDSLRVPPRIVHSATAGPDGARAVASWVTQNGQPLRLPPPE